MSGKLFHRLTTATGTVLVMAVGVRAADLLLVPLMPLLVILGAVLAVGMVVVGRR
jgi:hypothetical protein